MPHLMNCEHQGEGWCLKCVAELHDEATLAQTHVAALQQQISDPTAETEKLKKCIAALDAIAADYEHMKRKDMVERAGRVLCEIGAWRKVLPGEFARHGHVFSRSAGNPANP